MVYVRIFFRGEIRWVSDHRPSVQIGWLGDHHFLHIQWRLLRLYLQNQPATNATVYFVEVTTLFPHLAGLTTDGRTRCVFVPDWYAFAVRMALAV